MTIATITALPTVPATNDSGFEAAANALFTAIKDVMIGEINTMIGQINVYDFGLNMNVGNIVGLTAGHIPFGTGTGALSSSANLFWDANNARLGIGTASPATKLHVVGSGDADTQGLVHFFNPEATTAGRYTSIFVGKSTSAGGAAEFGIFSDTTTSTNARITIGHYGDNNNTQHINILSGGNVGIGTASPATKLDVDGIVKVKSYTVATQPSAVAGGIIYVSDDVGGAVLAFSDGSDWRRVTDRAVTSAT